MPTVWIKTLKGERAESWPSKISRVRTAIAEARTRYEASVANSHTIDLLGLSEAVTAELELRRPAIEESHVQAETKPKRT